jgi:hypothetical protein
VYIGKQQVMKDFNLGRTPGNLQEVTAITARILDSKPARLLPCFEDDV